ncbi:MAG: hypothetical protein J7604_05315 [Sporocytophaga sp.]|uniref:hypothetical protein n=1 Tax=Sporocytophaga sp. TaxID=2231183 RepID=UPI001B22967F|nr:hypothetical protein [Sporocytophaga sp.]MBO9699608.1 hypothetical protein [Sporocytophaga sp.]
MKNNIVIGLLIALSLGLAGATQSFAFSKEKASEVYPLKGPKKMKKNLFKRKKRYKNNTVVKIKRSGKGPNKGRRNYSNNFR